MKVTGIHHVSAITSAAEKNHKFFTQTLGMRLVKKTVNQDSTSSYHLFYADGVGSPGTDMTYFDIPMAGRTYPGVSSISNTAFRVPTTESLHYWKKRFEELNVRHDDIEKRAGRDTLYFEDEEGSRLMLVADNGEEGVAPGVPWTGADVPEEHAIVGLGPVTLTVRRAAKTIAVLEQVLGFEKVGEYPNRAGAELPAIQVMSVAEGGTGAEVHIEERPDLPPERPGRGSVHHVAFRIPTFEEYEKWDDRIRSFGLMTSGEVDRYYFRSIYFRESNGILFELATDEPGFATDEDMEHLGEELSLPPFLEPKRAQIEASLRPLEIKS
ncbi:ring-cleaving dioxygenase [Jeotgalibacillus haloalkalitolerans]|uniref:Ring-cleaving dioxygenase n=1 Tax=Jeotgalibacillus haloalkalitolerans TaxID=3104292 RepID=A0ABU5KIV4_9BACL|nr:ring-cleaving dioxygenase [Jeotgalibacillus sp. HH7-29]MDZ5711187.1 ring-cleaving dioxygenase [Jeotgalibacillus sp. HH7-29]